MSGTTPRPATDADVPAWVEGLGLPGLADIHVHFLPEPVLRKVWAYFDAAEANYGRPWPVAYRLPEADRIQVLRGLGLAAIPALSYAHRPGMARWLNEWSADFARRVPGAVHCATMFPEPGATEVVRDALDAGARLVKVHVQVGGFAPDDARLDGAWGLLEAARTPVVIHAGSAPLRGRHTGPEPVRRVLTAHPDLVLVIAHLGMPEYHAFADLAEEFDGVHLDTTMVATDFTEALAPMPADYVARLPGLGDRIVLGSDFPNIPYAYAHQLAALARLDLGDDWLRKVLWHNGARLMDLPSRASTEVATCPTRPRPT